MRPSPLFLGAMMLALGGMPFFQALQTGVRPSYLAVVLSLLLAVAGASLLLRRLIAFWLALAAGLVTAVLGGVGMAKGREIGLPLPSVVSLVAGIYMMFRAVLARGGLGPAPVRNHDDDAAEDESSAG